MTIGRPLEFNPDEALDAAMHLFWRKGYESTSLQDLITTMDLSKSSFYQAFKSKHKLFQRCILNYQEMLTGLMSAHLQAIPSRKKSIITLFYTKADETSGLNARRGCLTMNTASEFAQNDPEISALISQSIESFVDIFEIAVKQAQQDGEIPTDKDARSIAAYLVSSMSGLNTMIKSGADRESIKRIATIILSVLD
jgi:TetR/AcrR family transcriptional regulator, transcriptional repressor for nem operon